jgi:signal transduction histidine kinase
MIQLGRILLHGAIGLSLLLCGWVIGLVLQFPSLGLEWSRAGEVTHTAASMAVRPGDHILTIAGLPRAQFMTTLTDRRVGERVEVVFEREEVRQTVRLPIVQPGVVGIVVGLGPVTLALAFWLLGAVIWLYPSARSFFPSPGLFLISCLLVMAACLAYALTQMGRPWAGQALGVLAWWIGPVSLHTHVRLLRPEIGPKSRWALTALYGLALIGSLVEASMPPASPHVNVPWLTPWNAVWFLGHWVFLIVWLTWVDRHTEVVAVRRQIGGLALGYGLTLAAFVAWFALPNWLWPAPPFPFGVAFYTFAVIPLAYGYALLRPRLLRLDRLASYATSVSGMLVILGGLYVALTAAIRQWLSGEALTQPTTHLVLIAGFSALTWPVFRRLQGVVNGLFYGGWYDYGTTVSHISRVIDASTDHVRLARALAEELESALQLQVVCLLAPGGAQTPGSPVRLACPCAPRIAPEAGLDANGAVQRWFGEHPQPALTLQLRSSLADAELDATENVLLECPHIQLWWPLPGRDRPMALLLLGKRSGERLGRSDFEILEVVTRQASVALQNALLIAELKQRAHESAQLHHEIVRAREEERKRVSRELHDQVIQSLVGVNYQLAARREGLDEAGVAYLQSEIRRVVGEIRQICNDLRPPALDTLGLVAAVRAWVREAETQSALNIRLAVEGNEAQELPEDIALCLYRSLQEALFNVQQHSAATRVDVTLHLDEGEAWLCVEDDGRGFLVQRRLAKAADTGHIGLMGLRERLRLVQGTLEINSFPGLGTRLQARIPLARGGGARR